MNDDCEGSGAPPTQPSWDISPETLRAAAIARFGPGVSVSAPYWVDQERVRVGVSLEGGNVSFGADYRYQTGVFA